MKLSLSPGVLVVVGMVLGGLGTLIYRKGDFADRPRWNVGRFPEKASVSADSWISVPGISSYSASGQVLRGGRRLATDDDTLQADGSPVGQTEDAEWSVLFDSHVADNQQIQGNDSKEMKQSVVPEVLLVRPLLREHDRRPLFLYEEYQSTDTLHVSVLCQGTSGAHAMTRAVKVTWGQSQQEHVHFFHASNHHHVFGKMSDGDVYTRGRLDNAIHFFISCEV